MLRKPFFTLLSPRAWNAEQNCMSPNFIRLSIVKLQLPQNSKNVFQVFSSIFRDFSINSEFRDGYSFLREGCRKYGDISFYSVFQALQDGDVKSKFSVALI